MSRNDITGARLVSRSNTVRYEANYDRVFNKPDYDSGEEETNEDEHPVDAERVSDEEGY